MGTLHQKYTCVFYIFNYFYIFHILKFFQMPNLTFYSSLKSKMYGSTLSPIVLL